MIAVGVLGLGALGALMRWAATRWNRPGRPNGTLLVNVVAAFVLGLLGGASDSTLTVVGVGWLGSLSTFSTVMREAGEDMAAGERRRGAAYLAVTIVLGVTAATLGIEFSGR